MISLNRANEMKTTILLIVLYALHSNGDKPCKPRRFYGQDSFVCMCDASYCDEIPKLQTMESGNYVHFTSDAASQRFNKTTDVIVKYDPTPDQNIFDLIYTFFRYVIRQGDVKLKIDRSVRYQTIIGFGGAFTDSTGYNLKQISPGAVTNVINENGLEFNLGRVPMGGTDYSLRPYAYNMSPEDDANLTNFALETEDFNYKIPYIKRAMEVATDQIYLVATCWSPPIWMKFPKQYIGLSYLQVHYYQTYANYHIRFLEEYEKNGLSFWGITTGNEPINGNLPISGINTLGWLPGLQAKWIANHFGPTIRKSKFKKIKILAYDDQRPYMLLWLKKMSVNPKGWSYVDGIGVHYYLDEAFPITVVNDTHTAFPDKFILNTESSAGQRLYSILPHEYGSWKGAEYLMLRMLEYFNAWSIGWIDWNLFLDSNAGPIWTSIPVGSFLLRTTGDEFFKQPSFYAMGHFSKFVPRGSIRIKVEQAFGAIENVAFLRPDGGVTVVFYNTSEFEKYVTIYEKGIGFILIKLTANSIHTVIYW